MQTETLIAILATCFIWIVIVSLIVFGIIIFRVVKRNRNPIDISIYELMESEYIYRHEIGRRYYDPKKGYVVVTAGFMPSTIKESLGTHINDQYLKPSKMGKGRYHLAVCMKDGMTAPLNFARTSQMLNLSAAEEILMNKIREKHICPLKVDVNPTQLSLSPVLNEQVRHSLDIAEDAKDLYNDSNQEFAKSLMRWAILIFGIAVVGVIVIIVIMLNQGPAFVADMSGRAVESVVTNASNLRPAILPG